MQKNWYEYQASTSQFDKGVVIPDGTVIGIRPTLDMSPR